MTKIGTKEYSLYSWIGIVGSSGGEAQQKISLFDKISIFCNDYLKLFSKND